MISVLDKIMIPGPNIMFGTKIIAPNFVFTKANMDASLWQFKLFDYLKNNLFGIFCMISILIHSFFVKSLHVFAMALAKFQIFNPIIGFYSIFMVYSFFAFQGSAKELLHNTSMLKNSFAIYINTIVTLLHKAWLTFFKIWPVRRYFVIAVPKKSTSVHWANPAIILFQNLSTAINFTYFIFHNQDYNVKGKICQAQTYQ